jgi:Zn-dependent protease
MTNLLSDPLSFILSSLILIFSLSFHEFAHAYIADKLGDSTARYLGRVTLNPLAHLDPIGTICLLFFRFGWGKPVPFNPFNLRNPKRDSALISFAGPAANLILAGVFTLFFYILPKHILLTPVLYSVIYVNLLLAFFNLIPVHPLDGFKVVNGLLPLNLSVQWLQMEPYGIIILFIMILTGSTSLLLTPVVNISLLLLGLR